MSEVATGAGGFMKLYIASHSYRKFPDLPDIYQPLYVGAYRLPQSARNDSWIYDDAFRGNISNKNSTYCELTGLYNIWKQSNNDVVGLLHYRRFLASPVSRTPTLLTRDDVYRILESYDAITAQRVYFSKHADLTVAGQYRMRHSSTDLMQLKLVIERYEPSYLLAFNKVMRRPYLHPFNIIICRKPLLNDYAAWLFRIEKKLEARIDPFRNRDSYQQRVFGFLAERLLNVFLAQRGARIKELSTFDPYGSSEPSAPGVYRIIDSPTTLPTLPYIPPVYGGVDWSPVFDFTFYLSHYHDLARHFEHNPSGSLEHFIAYGITEKRMAHPHFSVASYMSGNPGLRSRLGNDPMCFVRHFLAHPEDNRHVVGYENFTVAEEKEPMKHTFPERLRVHRFRHFEQKAEALPVID